MKPERKAELERRIGVLLRGAKKPRFADEELALPPDMRTALEKFDRFNRQRKLSNATRLNQLDPVIDFGLFLAHVRGRDRYEAAVEEDFEVYQVEVPMPKSVAQLARTVLRKFYWHLEGGDGVGGRSTPPRSTPWSSRRPTGTRSLTQRRSPTTGRWPSTWRPSSGRWTTPVT